MINFEAVKVAKREADKLYEQGVLAYGSGEGSEVHVTFEAFKGLLGENQVTKTDRNGLHVELHAEVDGLRFFTLI
jgi:hypothetical protein